MQPVVETVTSTVRVQTPARSRNLSIGYLRAFITMLVVAHHAFLAYHTYAPAPAKSLTDSGIWMAFPVVDAHKWSFADLVVGYNDTFFMSLMFLISGMFVWSSLCRKGALGFFRDRVVRLGAPFVIGAALLAPLAYYPAYLQTARTSSFWHQWLSLGVWPAGPAWFLWVLVVFSGAAALLHAAAPGWGEALGEMTGRLSRRPVVYALALITASALVYVPMALAFTAERWFNWGPFFVQGARVFHYALYFFAGAGLGAYGLGRGLLAGDGKFARRWYLWATASVIAFAVGVATFLAVLATIPKGGPGAALLTFAHTMFVLSCAASSLAFLAIFLRFVRRANRVFDSLDRNAYGIYLFHYFCVSWVQLSLVNLDLPGGLKALLALSGALALSWMLTAAVRRIPLAARVVG